MGDGHQGHHLRRLALEAYAACGAECVEEETPFGLALVPPNHSPYRTIRPRVVEKKAQLVAVLPRRPYRTHQEE